MPLPRFNYSPFSRPLRDVGTNDLSDLKPVAEGWYIDYKRGVPEPDAAAKSLASFANTYGGWIIYGVDAAGGGSPVPSAFPGIALDDLPRLREMLQRGAGVRLQPSPFFEERTICGPNDEIGLAHDRAVVVVRVPPGADTPYVHANGRIYRRVADSSEPKPETDRHVLDLLWERSRSVRDRWTKTIEQEFVRSQAEDREPIAHVFLTCDPLGDRGLQLDLEFERFVEIMRDSSTDSSGLPFDNFFPTSNGFVARQVGSNSAHRLVCTWRQYLNTTAVISVPISCMEIDLARLGFVHLETTYEHMKSFADACRSGSFESGRVLDLNTLPFVIHGALKRYRTLLGASRVAENFFVKVRIDETWRCVPFVDLAEHSAFVAAHGVPVVQETFVFAPPGQDNMLQLARNRRAGLSSDEADRTVDTMLVMQFVATSLGVVLDSGRFYAELPALLERVRRQQQAYAS